jgi:hypothetical protein
MVAGGEFLLRQFQSAANDLRLRRPFHALEVGFSQRARVPVRARRALNGGGSHRSRRSA